MIKRLGLLLFIIGIFLILISFLRNLRTINTKSTQSAKSSSGSESQALITKVVDGDTVDVEINGKRDVVRLIGINAPETGECFGKESTDKAKEILDSKFVILQIDPTQDNRDKYKRLLRYIFLSNGTNFDELMIKDGFAKEYTFKTAYKYQYLFKSVQQDAKNNKKGLWADGVCE